MPRRAGSPYRQGRFDFHGFRQRFRDQLTSRFGLRLHMTLIVALVFAAAFLTTRLLFVLGVRSMGVRYLVASVTGYAAFFGLLRAWVWYVTTEAGEELEPEHSPDSVAYAIDPHAEPRSTPVPAAPAVKKGAPLLDDGHRMRREPVSVTPSDLVNLPSFGGGSSGSSGGGGGGGGLDVDGDGIVAVLVIAIVAIVAAALFGVAGYVIYQAPALLGEAAFEAVLASVLARSSRKVTRGGFAGSVLGATIVPALVVAVLATVGGVIAQGICPGPSTMGGVVKQCVLAKK